MQGQSLVTVTKEETRESDIRKQTCREPEILSSAIIVIMKTLGKAGSTWS